MVASTTVKCFETQQCATHPPQRDPPSPPPLASTDFGSPPLAFSPNRRLSHVV